uniref:NUDIX hydrolase n=1 Tax=Nonomuraea pusilla TaxID=46177 RepID=UPI00350E40F8
MTHDGDAGVPGSLAKALADVVAERAAQDTTWGMQALPDGTGGPGTVAAADAARDETGAASRAGTLTWRHILMEEVLEAVAEDDPGRLRAELVQVAAVAVKWIQSLDRRSVPPAEVRAERFRPIADVHVLLVRDGRVLLGRRRGTGYGDGLWHLPSGHLEADEPVTGAAVREAREELGVVVDPADLALVHVMHRAPERVGFFFAARAWRGEPRNAEPDKCSELAWWPLDGLPGDMVDYPAQAVAHVLDGVPFAERGWPPQLSG